MALQHELAEHLHFFFFFLLETLLPCLLSVGFLALDAHLHRYIPASLTTATSMQEERSSEPDPQLQ